MEEPRDEKLWRIASKRASFRRSLYSYILINSFLWCIWWFTVGSKGAGFGGVPWPCWVMLFWGFGIAKQYYDAYHDDASDLAEKE